MITVTKSWRDLPAAHRQPNHDGHCRLIHGHNWGFDITFGCDALDGNGFVVDVGKLKPIKDRLVSLFDHTLLINGDDPLLGRFRGMDEEGLIALVIVPNCGMDGLSKMGARDAQQILEVLTEKDGRKVFVHEVVCWEDGKNRASYLP